MNDQKITQAVIIDQAKFREHQKTERFAMFLPNGTPVSVAPHEPVAWDNITEVPTYVTGIAEATSAAEARTAIGAAPNVFTGYVIDEPGDGWDGTVLATDTLLEVIAKLEARIVELEELAE